MEKLGRAINKSIHDVKVKLRSIKEVLLGVDEYDALMSHVTEAKHVKEVQSLLGDLELRDGAVPPSFLGSGDSDDDSEDDLSTKAGKLRAFKKSILSSLWEIEEKLNGVSQILENGVSDGQQSYIISCAKAIKAVKEVLGLKVLHDSSRGSESPSSPVTIPRLSSNKLSLDPNSPLSPRKVTLDETDELYIPPEEVELEKEVGQGAFGKVYSGRYRGQAVAVKTMKIKDQKMRDAITREITLLKEINHRNVVKFIGLSVQGEDKAKLMLIMEFVKGGELYEQITDSSIEITWETKLRMACDITSALAYLHSKGMIHRDIKSENLLVSQPEGVVKLCDFGFARIVDETSTARMSLCGSFYFNSPETLLGQPYGFKADVYSMGIVLVELITRGAVDLTRTASDSYNLDVPSLTPHIPKECPRGFWQVALSMCNYNPESRPTASKAYELLCAVRNAYFDREGIAQ